MEPGMGRTLYLHIGHFKTGTTALQVFLARNPDFLARQRLDYAEPFRKNAKHSALAFAIYHAAGVETLMHGYADPAPPEELWELLFDYVRESPQPGVIVSSEEFMRLGGIEPAAAMLPRLARLGRGIDIRVIAYLREPEAHLRSWYNQLVKMRQKVPDFETALRGAIEPVHIDYARALRPWIEVFGAENVILRPYDESFRGGTGLYADFLSVLGVTLPERGLSLPEGDPNPRLDERTLELVRLMQNADFPRPLVRQVRERAQEHFAAEDALAAPGKSLDAVCEAIRTGLAGLEGLPRSSIDTAAFARRLPVPGPPAEAGHERLTGFLLSEINTLRTRLNKTQRELAARLEALEETGDAAAPEAKTKKARPGVKKDAS